MVHWVHGIGRQCLKRVAYHRKAIIYLYHMLGYN